MDSRKETTKSLIEALPNELNKQVIMNHLDTSSIIQLSTTSKHFYSLFNQGERQLALSRIKKLLNYVVKGNQDEAEKLLELFPDLLTCKGTVVDYSGRTIHGTALQIALGAEDTAYHKDEECMVEMIQKYFDKLSDGKQVMAAQIAEQFPEGWEKQEEERAKNDLTALKDVVQAIADSKNNDNCEEALRKFRDYLTPKGIIKTGKHFNAQLLVEAFKLYDKNFNRFGGFGSYKNNLCWRNVIGAIQRFLPACYAQAFCQGIYNIIKKQNGEKLNRSLRFSNDKNAVFFPLDLDPKNRLGVNYAAISKPIATGSSLWMMDQAISNLMSGKSAKLAELINPQFQSKASHPVMPACF